ncbi:MAG: hypothetical protein HXN75_10460 [Prevotella pallens]|nr:hypothetical protein [Prevotella pallens]
MTSDEWEYLMPTQGNLLLPTNNRVWRESGVTAAKWIRCHIKALYEQRADDPVWLRGFLIFPDDMPYSEAKALFKESNVTFGIKSRADDNETTFEKIRNSGAVFIPFSAYRAGGSNRLVQWGIHGNYATTSRYNLWKRVYHIKITPYPIDGVNFKVWTDPDQGCAVRLVQDL